MQFVSRKVAKVQSLKFSQKSQPRHSVERAWLVSSVAKQFGLVCGGISAANPAPFAAKFATAGRDKSRSGRRRKSAALSLLSGRVSLGRGRDADGRRPESPFVAACRWVVAQARGFPHRSGERRKSATVWLMAGAVSSATLRSCLAPTASRFLLQICSGVRPNSPQLSAASAVRRRPKSSWSGLGLASTVSCQQVVKHRLGLCGRAWYSIFVACKKKVNHSLAFLPRRLFHHPFSPPFFVQRWVCAHAGG